MKYPLQYFIIKASTILMLLMFYFTGCDDKSTGPVQIKDYPVYFYNSINNDGNWYFAYHPTTNQLDSFYLPFASSPMVSADGKKFYINKSPNITILDIASQTVIEEIPNKAIIANSPDNKLIAVQGDDGLHILRTSDYSEVFHDTDMVASGTFSSNSLRFYGGTSFCPDCPSPYAYMVDISDTLFPVTRVTFSDGLVYRIVPSIEENRWFLYLKYSTFGYLFAVYDFTTDSIIFRDFLWPGGGEIELTPNGKYVFYTNPGSMIGPTPGPPWLTVYDVDENSISQISTVEVFEEPYSNGVPVHEICITPDGYYLIALMPKSYPLLFTLDIRKMKINKTIIFGGGRFFEGLSCQNAP